jgi:Zn-dependent protease
LKIQGVIVAILDAKVNASEVLYLKDMIGDLTPTYLAVVIVSILISLVIHEFMHAWVGHQLGDYTAAQEGRLTLNPLSHIDPLMTIALPIVTILAFGAPVLAAKPVPFNPARVRRGADRGGRTVLKSSAGLYRGSDSEVCRGGRGLYI